MEVVIFICRTEKSQGIVTAQIEQETMRVTSPDFLLMCDKEAIEM